MALRKEMERKGYDEGDADAVVHAVQLTLNAKERTGS